MQRRVWLFCLAAATCASLPALAGAAATSPAQGWSHSLGSAIVTQPVLAGGRIVVYADRAGRLALLGLDPTNGKLVWSQPAYTSGNSLGEPPSLAVVGTTVVFLRDLPSAPLDFAQLAAVDAHTGRLLWHTATNRFSSWPFFCPGQGALICETAHGTNDGQVAGFEYEYDARTGAERSAAQISTSPYARYVGDGLLDVGVRDPEQLGAIDPSGHWKWTQTLAALFPLAGASTDWAWLFARDDASGVFIGSPGWPPVASDAGGDTYDLAHTMTAAFSIDDGRIVWQDNGSLYACSDFLPCGRVGVRLRTTGTSTEKASGRVIYSRSGRVWLEGFDPRTGTTLWRFDAGHDLGLATVETFMQLGPATIALPDAADHLERLDLESGSHRRIPWTTAGWCRVPFDYEQRKGHLSRYGGPARHEFTAELAVVPCNGRLQPVAAPPVVPAFVGRIGARTNGLIVWAQGNRLVAAPAP